jgi:hypothetical protein
MARSCDHRPLMKPIVHVPILLLGLAACGARTSMETCAEGSEECFCYANRTCEPGLVCAGEVCMRPATPTASGGAPGNGGAVVPVAGSAGRAAGGTMAGGTMAGGMMAGGMMAGGTMAGGMMAGGMMAGGMMGGMRAGGGVVGSGGGGSGGAAGGGGATAASGGTQGSGGTMTAVTLVAGRADGAMTGWGWVAFGEQDTVTSPTCGGRPIVAPGGCDTGYDWSPVGGLCVSGTVPVVTNGDYASNWGILFAANCREPAGGSLGDSYQSVSLNLTGVMMNGLRVVVHRRGDPDAVNYCASMTPGKAVQLTSLNTACWDNTGTPLMQSDVPNLDWVGVQVPSSPSSAYKLSGLCLNAIIFQ